MLEDRINYHGKTLNLKYYDCNDFYNLDKAKVRQVYGVCFYNSKLLIGYDGRNWSLIGGRPEDKESYEETLIREVFEESNMKVLKQWPIGYQYVLEEDIFQLRFAAIVEPYGIFGSDPAGQIKEIKLIESSDYKNYFNHGVIGDRIIKKGIEKVKVNA